MVEPNAIRIVDTALEDLEACNIEHIVRVFGDISQTPKYAKLLRAKVVLGFPSYELDPRPNYAIPSIRKFIRALDQSMPYFPYFLVDNLVAGQVQFYLFCLLDPAQIVPEWAVSPRDILALIKLKEQAIREFCYRIADSTDEALNSLVMSLPAEFLRESPELSIRALRSLKDILEAIATDLATGNLEVPGLSPEQVRSSMETVLDLAGQLSRLDRSQYASDLDYVHAILAHMA